MAEVKLEKLKKIFPPNITALHNVDLEIKDKEFMVLVGPSGCGKSTILRLIAGLEEPTAGNIYIGTRPVNDIPAKERDVAMVFQNYALYPHMNVFENMAFGLRIRGYPQAEIKQRVEEAAEMLAIKDILHRFPRQLSGGERQRVAVGRAIVRKPQVFLFDEPLSNLDAQLRVQMRAELRKLYTRLTTTTIYVTHDQLEAMTMGDRIAVMKEGRILQIGEPLYVYHHPANKFVAGFIGLPPMNFIEGTIRKEGGGIYFYDGQKIKLKITEDNYPRLGLYIGKEIILGIRPEDIHERLFVSYASQDNVVNTTCEMCEPMGSEVYLHLKAGRHFLLARVDSTIGVKENQDIEFVFDMTKAHFFDKDSEEAIV